MNLNLRNVYLYGKPIEIASFRGVALGLGAGASAALASFQMNGDPIDALVVGLSALVAAFMIRAGGEGYADRKQIEMTQPKAEQ